MAVLKFLILGSSSYSLGSTEDILIALGQAVVAKSQGTSLALSFWFIHLFISRKKELT